MFQDAAPVLIGLAVFCLVVAVLFGFVVGLLLG